MLIRVCCYHPLYWGIPKVLGVKRSRRWLGRTDGICAPCARRALGKPTAPPAAAKWARAGVVVACVAIYFLAVAAIEWATR